MSQTHKYIAIESDRKDPSSWGTIHLFKNGDFWKAYEWSAWLIATVTYTDEVRMTTSSRRPLHVTRMNRTDAEGTYCFVGFPVRSIEKFIPTRQDFRNIDDNHIVISVALPNPQDGTELTGELLAAKFNEWKDGVTLAERKKKEKKAPPTPQQQVQHPSGGLLSQIMAYPLSERTAVDNINFIQSLKQQVSAIL